MFCKKGVLKIFTKFTRKHLCQSFFFNKVAGLRLAQVFSCEFCKIFKNIFFHETPPVAAYNIENWQKRTPFYGTTTSGCFWSSLLLLLITLMFVFDSNSKSFNKFKSSIYFSLKSISSVLFSIFFFRSSCLEVFCKKGVLRNFPEFTKKTPASETLC